MEIDRIKISEIQLINLVNYLFHDQQLKHFRIKIPELSVKKYMDSINFRNTPYIGLYADNCINDLHIYIIKLDSTNDIDDVVFTYKVMSNDIALKSKFYIYNEEIKKYNFN